MNPEIINLNGYVGIIEYFPDIHCSYPKSKQYRLIVLKDGKQCRNLYGFTLTGAKKEFIQWVKKQENKIQ